MLRHVTVNDQNGHDEQVHDIAWLSMLHSALISVLTLCIDRHPYIIFINLLLYIFLILIYLYFITLSLSEGQWVWLLGALIEKLVM